METALKLEELDRFLCGKADEALKARVVSSLNNPKSELSQFLTYINDPTRSFLSGVLQYDGRADDKRLQISVTKKDQ
ncbi:MAG TPA: hypothetical protein VHA78_06265 [Candidatus Peribacteraceae bacterium]|nr:hypothetical protein [Candidatus Peribacteraceae bacterium]